MVLNVSGEIDEEDTTEEGDFGLFSDVDHENIVDSDMSDIPHGSVMANPRITSLFTTQRSWRVLRLPGGRAGDEGASGLRGFSNFMLQIIPGWRGQTIRDSPFRQMVSARMWQQYINNMEPIDDALEIQAPYSPEEMLSLRMFCEEWNDDPGHIRFTRRLAQHPSTNNSDAILKGNMVYDLCTGQIQLRTSRGDRGEGNIPIRLAHDILTSIPFDEYNFYTLNSVHAHEGATLYEQFLNRYVRLSSTEVAMVEEIENGIRGGGRGYATMSTNITGDPIEAFALMQQTIEAMEIGDTTTVRAHLNALISPPYNYQSMAQQIDVGGTHGGRFVTAQQIRYHNFQAGNLTQNSTYNNAASNLHMIIAQGRATDGSLVMWPQAQLTTNANTHPPLGFYMEMNQSGTGVERVWEVFTVGNAKHIRIADYDSQARAISDLVGGFNRRDRQAVDQRAPGQPDRDAADRRRGVRGPRANPVRDNFFGAPSYEVPPPSKTGLTLLTENDFAAMRSGMFTAEILVLSTKTKAWLKKNQDNWRNAIEDEITHYSIKGLKKALSKEKHFKAFMGAAMANGYKMGDSLVTNKQMGITFVFKGKFLEYDEFEAMEDKAIKMLKSVYENPPSRSDMSGYVRKNRFGGQTTMGRGKYIYVQVLPKTQMSFTGKYKGRSKQTQYWDHGATSVADSTGLSKVFSGGPSNDGYFIKKGLHKRTQTAVPWMLALPRKSFQAFTDSEGRRTIRPKHRKAEADPAWAKFTRLYGVPTYAGEPGKQNLFKIKKADRGKFYDNLRARPTKR